MKKTKIFALVLLGLGGVFSSAVAQNKDEQDMISKQTALDIEERFTNDFDPMENMEIPALLFGSRDAFVNATSYNLSPFRFRSRGLDAIYTQTLMNGIEMNDANTGRTLWALWGGLNDAMRNSQSTIGLMPVHYSMGNIGGSQYLDVRASAYRPGTRLTYSRSNRSYPNRLMAHYASGKTSDGWSVVLSLSKRWGPSGYVEGTYYDARAMFLGIEKEFNPHHSLALTLFTSPVRRGVMGGSTQEVYDLVGSNYYNPNVGYIGDKARNARVRDSEEPILFLTHDWTINPDAKVSTTAMYRMGFNGYSALNWIGQDPRPDYYRNLPSFFDGTPAVMNEVAEAWKSGDRTITHIDWERMYRNNELNDFSVRDANGDEVANGKRAVYIVEDRRTDQRQFSLASTANIKLTPDIKLDGGVRFMANKTMNFTTVKDLLGADFWYDVDKFAERDFAGDISKAMSDLNNPFRVAREGDKFGHDYNTYIYKPTLWAQGTYTTYNFESYAGLQLGTTTMYRDGQMKKGLFPENSFGKSDVLNYFDYDLRLGTQYKLSGHHYFTANIQLGQHAPRMRDVFVSPRTRNTIVSGLTPEKFYSGDISYLLRTPFVKARITGYFTRLKDKNNTISFYDDEKRAFGQYVMTGIGEQYVGAELGVEWKISPTITATAGASMGDYFYYKNANYEHYVDNTEELLGEGTVYWKNFKVSGTPMKVASVNLSYNSPRYWFLGVTANYAADSYISMNPTLRAANNFNMEGFKREYADQENFGGHYTIDANIGGSWRFDYKYYLSVNLSVSNILNNTNIKTGGYEQMRNRYQRSGDEISFVKPFDKKYFYMFGLNYFLNVNFRF